MRGRLLLGVVLLALMAVAPSGQAAFTKPLPFDATAPYMADISSGGNLTLVSGQVGATAPDLRGSIGALGVDAFRITGLTKACWQAGNSPPQCPTGTFSIDVAAGSSVAMCFPAAVDGEFTAGHALALFVDLSSDDDLNTLPVARSLIAPAVDGHLELSGIPAIADAVLSTNPCATSGAIVALDGNTTLTLRQGSNSVQSFTGKTGRFIFAGTPRVEDFGVEFVVLPFAGRAEATFGRASAGDADEGLDGARLSELIGILDQSHANGTTDRDSGLAQRIEDLPEAVTGLLNGAFLQIPAGGEGEEPKVEDIAFARFKSLSATADGGDIVYDGRAYLAVDDGHVTHTHKLVGIKLLALPILGIVLWVLAIAALVVRIVLKVPKPATLTWLGWITTPIALLLVFVLVDAEVNAMLGASVLNGSSGRAMLIYLGLDVALVGIVSVVAGAPLRMLLRNGLRFTRIGALVGIASGLAWLLAFFLSYTYFRDYLDLVFSQAVGKLG